MNSYSELPFQYKQDVWSLMFVRISEKIMEYCGRNGEASIRRAVREMGKERGSAAFAAMKAAGKKADLMALYHENCAFCTMDPRCRKRMLCEEKQKYIYEIDTCPLSGYWDYLGAEKLGNLFCEEFEHGQLAAYSHGTGQVNLATRLTYKNHTENVAFMDDNVCRFSVYHRSANAKPEFYHDSFGDETALTETETSGNTLDLDEDIHLRAVQICHYLINTAEEDFGEEGLCAVGLALRSMVPEMAEIMKKHADDLLQICDSAFMALHFPMPMDSSVDRAWAVWNEDKARILVQNNFLTPLKKKLGIC